jgi:hypothetical protein
MLAATLGAVPAFLPSSPGLNADNTFARLCDGDGGLVGLLAVDTAGYALGLADLIFHPRTWAEGQYCCLKNLFVD